MHSLDPNTWSAVRGMILNELSERFSQGYLAAELLGSGSVQKSNFLFGFANEVGNKRTSLKLRVILAKEQLLKTAWQMNQSLDSDGKPQEPVYETDFHRHRWIYAVKNMANLYHDEKRWDENDKPLRRIELYMAAAAVPDAPCGFVLRLADAHQREEAASDPRASQASDEPSLPSSGCSSEPPDNLFEGLVRPSEGGSDTSSR